MEFRKLPKNSISPMNVEVPFFCLESCVDLVKKWFTHWHALDNKEEEEEIDDADRT